MIDLQSSFDDRQVDLEQVGIEKFRMPLSVLTQRGFQSTVAQVSLAVDVPSEIRGTHMSRFVEELQTVDILSPASAERLLQNTCARLQSRRSFCLVDFCAFMSQRAPVSCKQSYLDVDCSFRAQIDGSFSARFSVTEPVTSLCPCSKAISEQGAHNQRAYVALTVEADASQESFPLEELVVLAEESSSSPVYSLLKRPDEKFVTEQAYERARFVEDIARECAVRLQQTRSDEYWQVRVSSKESIHNHNACALVTHHREVSS